MKQLDLMALYHFASLILQGRSFDCYNYCSQDGKIFIVYNILGETFIDQIRQTEKH